VGGVAPAESGIRQVYYCPGCRATDWSDLSNPEGLIDPRNWDGSDFFVIWPMPAFFFVTERVVEVFRRSGLKGAEFAKTFPAGGGMGFSPPRLSHVMPKDRAHEIGDPLDIY
jgi:hypothetical protein